MYSNSVIGNRGDAHLHIAKRSVTTCKALNASFLGLMRKGRAGGATGDSCATRELTNGAEITGNGALSLVRVRAWRTCEASSESAYIGEVASLHRKE